MATVPCAVDQPARPNLQTSVNIGWYALAFCLTRQRCSVGRALKLFGIKPQNFNEKPQALQRPRLEGEKNVSR